MKRSSWILSLLAGLLLVATAVSLFRSPAGLPEAALRGLPADAWGFARVRLARVLASRAYREIVVARGAARGIERVTKICDFNPLAGLEEVWLSALPQQAGRSLVASARGTLQRTKLIDCVARYSGGSLQSFSHERVAGFDVMRSKKGSSSAAFVGRDGVVVGDARGVQATLRTIAGEAEAAAHDPFLRELHGALAEDSDVALLLRLPSDPAQRAQLVDRLMLPPGAVPAELRALTADVHLIEDRVRLDLRLWTHDEKQAGALAADLDDARDHVLDMPGLGLLGIGAPLRETRVEAVARDVKLHIELRAKTITTVMDMLPVLARLPAAQSGALGGAADAGVAPEAGR